MLDRPAESAPRPMPLADGPPTYYQPLPGSVGDLILLVGRVAIGWVFLVSGFGKITAVTAFSASLAKRGVPAPELMGWIGAIVEVFGGLAVVLGFKTRWAALLMALFTVVATFISHRYWEYPAAERAGQLSNFMKNLAIVGGFLFLFISGPGRFSIDAMWRRSAG